MSEPTALSVAALRSLSCGAVLHPWTDSCVGAFAGIVRDVVPKAFPLYISVYLVRGGCCLICHLFGVFFSRL